MKNRILIILIINILAVNLVFSQEKKLSLEEFIKSAVSVDSQFETFLAEKLEESYKRRISEPAKTMVLSVREQLEFSFNRDKNSPETSISLDKLFPYEGTELSLDYSVNSDVFSSSRSSRFSVSFAKDIAQNAFGKNSKMLKDIAGIEYNIAYYQIVEAYEDYLSSLIKEYYSWYENYIKYDIGRNSYNENLKLEDNINERYRQKIALDIDRDKVSSQLLSKKEDVIKFEEKYLDSVSKIKKILRIDKEFNFIPVLSDPYSSINSEFGDYYEDFTKNGRTFSILKMIEEKSGVELSILSDALLPSLEIFGGFDLNGEGYNIRHSDNNLYVGITYEKPLYNKKDKLKFESGKNDVRLKKLEYQNSYYDMYSKLYSVYLSIKREKQLLDISDEKIRLAKAVLDYEKENYSLGKITLNDYIQSFNSLDNNRLNKISHEVLYRELIVEWLRLKDELVSKIKTIDESGIVD